MSEPLPSEMTVIDDAEQRGRTDLRPFWRRVYAQGDPLPRFAPPAGRPAHRFDEEVRKAVGATVGDVMTPNPETCSEDDTVEAVATALHDHNVYALGRPRFRDPTT